MPRRSTKRSSPTEARYAARLKAAMGPSIVWTKVHGGPFQAGGIADLLLCVGGAYVAVELKRPGERPTARQEAFLDQVRRAGGAAMVITTNTTLDAAREAILDNAYDMSRVWFGISREGWKRTLSERPRPALRLPRVRQEVPSVPEGKAL